MEQLKSFIEKYGFGVCSYLAEKLGIQTSRVRVFFIYITFVTMGSPIIFYLITAFWVNIKKYLRRGDLNYR
ncbi:MAG TPA: PspC domain-containing protein [Saprospiraceae bacterium]|nr:PspC domain-containing protein [Saprospiraceae bacterium]MCB9327444.1 PspC domain-containing protein [Lewinellaceae bacterium]HRX29825.1 PspC domain-containing protein [Saprospiraceae bacterium]